MTDNLAEITPPDSTVLDEGISGASGGSISIADSMKLALDQVRENEPVDDKPVEAEKPTDPKPEKAKPEAKVDEKHEDETGKEGDAEKPSKERAPDGKFKPKDAPVEGEVDPATKQDDGEEKPGQYRRPEKLLPDAKDQWYNVPRAVKRDIDTMLREHETEIAGHKERTERYESIRPFDEMAKSNGRDLRESLVKLNNIENMMQSNPLAGLNAILQEIGPRKADGSAVSLYEVAEHIVNQGQQGYQQTIAQANQQQQVQQRDAYTQQLEQRVQQMEQQTVFNEIEAKVIAPFKAAHPRYDELSPDIAFFIETGRVPADLNALDRLEAAYTLAERLNPAPGDPSKDYSDKASEARVGHDLDGRKSIRTGPGALSPSEEVLGSKSIEDVLRENLKKVRG